MVDSFFDRDRTLIKLIIAINFYLFLQIFLNMIAEMVAGYWLALLFETSHDNGVVSS